MQVRDYISEIEFIDIFADNLKSLMIEIGMSQTELARESGLAKSTISRILNKQHMPNMKVLMNLCYVLGCSYDDLLPTYSFVR